MALDTFEIGTALKFLREQRTTYSARQLSLICKQSESYIAKLERNELEPSFSAFARIARKLQLNDREIACLVLQESLRS